MHDGGVGMAVGHAGRPDPETARRSAPSAWPGSWAGSADSSGLTQLSTSIFQFPVETGGNTRFLTFAFPTFNFVRFVTFRKKKSFFNFTRFVTFPFPTFNFTRFVTFRKKNLKVKNRMKTLDS